MNGILRDENIVRKDDYGRPRNLPILIDNLLLVFLVKLYHTLRVNEKDYSQ